jgi:hypothetical protein
MFCRYGETFQIVTNGSSKSEYEWLIQNPRLVELADSDYGFTLARKNWNASYDKSDMPHVIDELQSLGINVVITGAPAEQLQQELVTENEKSSGNWKKISWNETNIPKTTQKIKFSKPQKSQSSQKNDLHLLELEMQMEIEIMQMELEMGLYKNVAGTF